MELAEHFLSGAAALTVSYAVVHPLDTLRTQMQADGATALSALRANSLRTLLKGFGASVAGAAPQVSNRGSIFVKSHLDFSILFLVGRNSSGDLRIDQTDLGQSFLVAVGL